jgi:hypothetical protein
MSFGMVLAAIVGGVCCLMSLAKWRFGFYGLLLFLPFAGLTSLLSGQSALGLLAKDIVFVIPSYVSFFLLSPKDSRKSNLPGLMYLPMNGLAVFVIFQAGNPAIPDILVALIGAKVWLLYMPLAFMAGAAIDSEEDLWRFLRFNVVLGLVPTAVGLLQLVGIQTIGVESTAATFYGSDELLTNAHLFSQLGDYGSLYRINSTFAAVGQYYIYTLTLVSLSATVAISDPVRVWRLVGVAALFVAVTAAFLSGQRGALLFVPIVLVPIMVLSGRIGELVVLACLLPFLYVGLLTVSGVDVNMVINDVGGFTTYYAEEYGWNMVIDILADNPMGVGTGMNTGAARYAFGPNVALNAVESYYLKSVVELSALALPIVIALLWFPVLEAIKLAASTLSTELRRCAAGFSGFFIFVALLSVRAWPIDLDPVDVYFWVLVGVLFKLRLIGRRTAGEAEATEPAMHESRLPAFATADQNL